jgi:hypothetical protein
MPKLKLQSKSAQYLQNLLDEETKDHPIDHPVLSILMGQLSKLMVMIDTNPEFQQTCVRVLNKVKETWSDDSALPPAP